MSEKDIRNLISLLDKNKKNQIMNYWSQISKYQTFNELFQETFKKAIEDSYFDYSLIGVSIYQQKNRIKFVKDLNECKNHVVKFLFHGTQIGPIAKIITTGFLYAKKAFYGMGVYFSDMLDYVSFYCGGKTLEQRRENFGKTIPVNDTFSCVATEIFYNNDRKKDVYGYNYYVEELDHFPTYEEVEAQNGYVFEDTESINLAKKEGKFIGKDYCITEKDQMLPLYGLTLKRNEYFVIWRDPNFVGKNDYTDYLINAKMILYKNEKINVYIESCTEKALELINRKKYNKIILISSIGLDLSGKKFVETARKILGFDVMVLFFSSNKEHLKWIQNFPNALYTDTITYYEKYVRNYNEKGLLSLKKEIEDNYGIKLKFTKDYLQFPNFVDKKEYCDMIFEKISPNFRKVIIINKKNQKALYMNEDKTVKFANYEGRDVEPFFWYITLIDNEMTLFSNNSYLYYDTNNKKVKGYQFMIRWKFEKENEKYYYIYYENKNNILTADGENVIIKNQKIKEYQLFYFIDENTID